LNLYIKLNAFLASSYRPLLYRYLGESGTIERQIALRKVIKAPYIYKYSQFFDMNQKYREIITSVPASINYAAVPAHTLNFPGVTS